MNSVVAKLLKYHLHFNNLKVFTFIYMGKVQSIYLAPSKDSKKYSLDLSSQQVYIMK